MNFEKSIPEIEKRIGYTFNDKSLLKQAFTRTSYCNEHKGAKYQSNEVLEFFGDSLLSAAIVTLLMSKFAKRYEHGISTALTEGDFSNIRSKLSDKKNLSRSAKALGLQNYLLMGEGDAKLGVENEPSVAEDLFESIIGAVYIDSDKDMGAVITVVARMLDAEEYLTAAPPIQSAKNALQEFCADKQRRLPTPVYKTISESGPDHKKIYERACYIGDRVYGTGEGKNQKLADAEAARAALAALVSEEERTRAQKSCTAATLAVQELKKIAEAKKIPTPEFRDLGETARSTDSSREYAIECRFAGYSSTGEAKSKQEAKASACEMLLAMLKKQTRNEKNKKKPAPVSKKSAKPIKNRQSNKNKKV